MTNTRIAATALVVSMIAGGLGWVFAQGTTEEDRPAMIVRNGSIIFENGTVNGRPVHWLYADALSFKTDQQNGKRVISADATVTGGSGQCNLTGGRRFRITFQEQNDSEDIHLIAAGQEPKIFPNDVLTRSSSRLQLTRGTAGAGQIFVRMDNGKVPCVIAKTGQITFKFNHPQ